MFEAAEVGAKVDDQHYERELPELRRALLDAQHRLAAENLRLMVVVTGVPKAGRGEVVNTLLEWMDARGIETHPAWPPSDEERERPEFWRYWRLIPPSGRTGIFFGGWYARPLNERILGKLGRGAFERSLDRIIEFERMLVEENTLVVKFWLHLSKKAHRARLKELTKHSATRWRVTKSDYKFAERYRALRAAGEQALRRTSTDFAPWIVVEGGDRNHRNLTVGRVLLRALEARLAQQKPSFDGPVELPKPGPINVLNQLDLSLSLSKESYEKKAPKVLGKLGELSRTLYQKKRSLILVFEGPDAAGKGGTIRRVTQALDARAYKVIAVAAPSDEERAHPYLWRFWRHLPRRGQITIYDRSWYGRVLVERIEGFWPLPGVAARLSRDHDSRPQLTDFGTIVLKFWLAPRPEEQLERFKKRERTPYKQYKLSDGRLAKPRQWDAYKPRPAR